jgi:type IV pilus assembly protein PilB
MQLQDPRKQKEFLRKFQNINRKMEEEETAKRAVDLDLPYIDLGNFPLDLNSLALLTKEQAEETKSLVFFKDGQDVRIGTAEPNHPLLLKIIKDFETSKKYKIQTYLISESSFSQVVELYAKIERPEEKHSLQLIIDTNKDYASEIKILDKPPRILSATEILELIFGAAEKLGASDVHCEPEERFVKIRLRLDGVLNDIAHLPKEYQKSLNSRVKVLSKLKLNVENVPQDGRFSYQARGKYTDVRVSMLPSAYGEVIVMRILGNQAVDLKLDDLGFTGKSYRVIKEEISKPNGMIVTTGPTGSGKTTTLYAFLNQLNQPGVNIITLEDPV